MKKKELLIIEENASKELLSLEQLCEICGIPIDSTNDFIAYAIIVPIGKSKAEWKFDNIQLQRMKIALRLQRDLEVNLAGAALVLDLLDELHQMRAQAALLDKFFSE